MYTAYCLTQKEVGLKWTESGKSLLTKSALTPSPVLTYPDFALPFILDTDASGDGIGTVLSQVQRGREKVISYASKKLSKTERKYSVTRREMLAAVVFVQHYKHYLYGRRFTLKTGHGSLRWLSNFKAVNAQVARWFETLAMFKYEIQHRPGARHGNADALSRRPSDVWIDFPLNCHAPSLCCGIFQSSGWDHELLREVQREDGRIGPILRWLEQDSKRPPWKNALGYGWVTKASLGQWNQLVLKDRILYRRFESPHQTDVSFLQPVVPYCLREEVLKLGHDARTAGHLGQARTLKITQKSYYWPGYREDIELWVNSCLSCQTRKRPVGRRRQAPMQVVSVGEPMERVALDIMGPLPSSNRDNKFTVVVMDYFKK